MSVGRVPLCARCVWQPSRQWWSVSEGLLWRGLLWGPVRPHSQTMQFGLAAHWLSHQRNLCFEWTVTHVRDVEVMSVLFFGDYFLKACFWFSIDTGVSAKMAMRVTDTLVLWSTPAWSAAAEAVTPMWGLILDVCVCACGCAHLFVLPWIQPNTTRPLVSSLILNAALRGFGKCSIEVYVISKKKTCISLIEVYVCLKRV